MSAEVELLRRAAALMRERANATKSASHTDWGDRPWAVEPCGDEESESCACVIYQGEYRKWDEAQVPLIQYVADAESPEHAVHIAAWHPAVARAVADLMDHAAAQLEREIARLHAYGLEPFEFLAELYEPSLAVARQYLGEVSDAS